MPRKTKKAMKKEIALTKAKYYRYNEKRKHYDPEWVKKGKRLTALRMARDLSQQQVADAIGKSVSYYKHMEQGYNNLSSLPLTAKNALENILRADIEDLF